VRLGLQPVILCSPAVRFYFSRLTEEALSDVSVVSYQEIEPSMEVEAIGKVDLE